MVLALATKDALRLRSLFSSRVTFRAVTPSRFWDAETLAEIADVFLGNWFGPAKVVTHVDVLESDKVGDVEKPSCRLRINREGGAALIVQVAFYTVDEGQITDLRLVCSGFRPIEASTAD